ncbi:MAG: YdeI/OmpD-associated family protein [Rhodobacter sp.]|nr:YdeI/OmpD-associated family protein [Paracoccaceae bacterium]MCC0074977.1 YdeI/OmpD-associated family protein [Rhodobacter sp.]
MSGAAEGYFLDGCGRCARFATDDCSARHWAEGLARLRQLCRDAGLEETLRWSHPCYRHAGRNLALLGAFREDFRITFPDADLLDDPAGLLQPAGPNSRAPTTIRFTALADIDRIAPALTALLAQARTRAEAGERPSRAAEAPELPALLVEALDADPEMAEGFAALTPGRQRSYVLALSSAKTEATQRARIARFRDRILAGKGATER